MINLYQLIGLIVNLMSSTVSSFSTMTSPFSVSSTSTMTSHFSMSSSSTTSSTSRST